MNETQIAEIIEKVNQLRKLGCEVTTDMDGQIIVYTGLRKDNNGDFVPIFE
jgi:hypothetical protein